MVLLAAAAVSRPVAAQDGNRAQSFEERLAALEAQLETFEELVDETRELISEIREEHARAGGNSTKARQQQAVAEAAKPRDIGAAPAPSQNLSVSSAPAEAGFEIEPSAALAASAATGVSGRSLRSTPAPEFEFLVSADDSTASLSLTFDLSSTNDPRTGRYSAEQLNLSGTTSLSDGEGSFLGLDSLNNGTEFKLSYVSYFTGNSGLTNRQASLERRRVILDAVRACESVRAVDQCNPNDPATTITQFVRTHLSPARARRLIDSATPDNLAYLGIEGSASQQNFTFFQPDTILTESDSRFGFGGTIFGGMLFGEGLRTSLGGSFTYSRRYRAQSSVTLCQPNDETNLTQCRTAAAGTPARNTRSIIGLELRHAAAAPFGEYSSLAIAPEVNFDLESDDFSIDVPIYFIPKDGGHLRGGLRASYVNARDSNGDRNGDFSLGMFVGVPFSLFGP
ncbi:hypothetical protein [Hyphomonas sp.]|uniref:hypothetical protein n=1 Tax=Hyphomonas sp. TaxID=87 RepID=UPI0032976105